MNLRDFRRTGHWPTLLCAFLYFDISFMVWVLIGALANSIVPAFDLDPFQQGLLVGTPLLGGAILRLVLGLLADHLGARRTGILGMLLTILPLLLGWLWADSFDRMLLVGLLLGVAGASFAVALPLASRWYPPQYQGLALGIAGAGNSGTAVATLFGPMLAEQLGWQAVFGLALIPISLTLVLFSVLAKDGPSQPAPRRLSDYLAVLRQRDAWSFCLFYAVTFGGFVGLASFLGLYFHGQHGLGRIVSGALATLCVLVGSCLRPVGGYLADRFGGISLLTILYAILGVLMFDLATSPPLIWSLILFLGCMVVLGLGNGAVFQLVPQRFPQEIGVITGIVGAAGGLGGFLLPTLLGGFQHLVGSYSGGYFFLAVIAFVCVGVVVNAGQVWEGVFIARGGLAPTAGDTDDTTGGRDSEVVAQRAG